MRVAAYVRVSTSRQVKLQTIEQQLEMVRRHAQEQGWELLEEDIFRDDGFSGTMLGRSALGRQLERLTEAYLGEVIPLAEYHRRRKDLEQRGEALAAQERQLQAQSRQRMELTGVADSIEDFCRRVRGGLAEATFEQKRKLVELLIDRVIVTGEEVEIRYVIPTDPSSEQVRFCHLRSDYLHYPPTR